MAVGTNKWVRRGHPRLIREMGEACSGIPLAKGYSKVSGTVR